MIFDLVFFIRIKSYKGYVTDVTINNDIKLKPKYMMYGYILACIFLFMAAQPSTTRYYDSEWKIYFLFFVFYWCVCQVYWYTRVPEMIKNKEINID